MSTFLLRDSGGTIVGIVQQDIDRAVEADITIEEIPEGSYAFLGPTGWEILPIPAGDIALPP